MYVFVNMCLVVEKQEKLGPKIGERNTNLRPGAISNTRAGAHIWK